MKKVMVVSNLSYSIDGRKIVDDIDLELEDSIVNAVLSSNNGGKTTLIRLLSGIYPHKSGKISVNDIELNKDNFKKYIINISTILDDIDDQFVCDTVKEEIEYPLINLKYKSNKINDLYEEILDFIKINNISNKRINSLTHYEKIKVLLAASIIHNPKVLLIDDVLRFLNKEEKEEILRLFDRIANDRGITILFTTSNLNDVKNISNIYILNNGRIVMNDSFESIIMKDNELSKMGIEVPIMIDLSRKLEFYKLIDKIYYDPDKVVDALWK